jgi:hypothetical protein
MKTRLVVFAAAGIVACACWSPVFAQATGPGGGGMGTPGGQPMGNHMGQNNMTQEQFNQVQEYADQAKRLTKEDKAKGKTLADLLAEDKAAAAAMTATMPLSCQVDEAMLAAQGPETIDGKTVNTKTYEAACANGMGYFLTALDPGKPFGMSCFAADATHAADVAAGRPPGTTCQLPPNADLNAMATAVLSHAGTSCTVKAHRWVGQNSATNTEFDEMACADGTGYMVALALPGSAAPVRVTTCHDSAMRGLPCKLSDNGVPVLTLQTFKDALAQHNIACNANSEGDMHFFGQETGPKRYVVEFRCAQAPGGLVAFIPLNGNRAPFETLDCKAAAKKYSVKCSLTKTN